jgi:hypothetical protein
MMDDKIKIRAEVLTELRDKVHREYAEAEERAQQILEDARKQRDSMLRLLSANGEMANLELPRTESKTERTMQLIREISGIFDREEVEKRSRKASIPITPAVMKHVFHRMKENGELEVVSPAVGGQRARYRVVSKGGDDDG